MSRNGYERHGFLEKHIQNNDIRRIMEIGVYNGENAKNMIKTAQKNVPATKIEYYGFDTFGGNFGSTQKEVENKLSELNSDFKLVKGDTRNTLPELADELPQMDLIFIDGGHGFEIVKNDWKYSKSLMKDNTTVFFHNYERSGVKRVVNNVNEDKYSVEILNPSSDYKTAKIEKVHR